MKSILDIMPRPDKEDGVVWTPREVVEKVVSILPNEVWNHETKFLDPVCKSGVFLEVVLDKLMQLDYYKEKYPDIYKRRIEIVNRQLFGICENVLTKAIVERTLYCEVVDSDNIVYLENYRKRMIKEEWADIIKKEFGENMKFDVVVGNPPYNNDMYLDFVAQAYEIGCKFMCMITPAKWQTKNGAKNKYFRDTIVPHMSKLVYYPDSLDIFAIQEADGVCYYLIDRENHDKCEVENRSVIKPIINGVETRDIRHEQSLWNCGNSVVEKLGQYTKYNISKVKNRKKYTININKQLVVATGSSGCWDWNNSCIKSEYAGKGGVIFTENGVNILGFPKLVTDENDKSSDTSINVFTSDNIDECKSFVSWAYTKFVRFLLLANIGSLTMMTQHGWRFVPDPGKFDHIFTDEELYKRYNLTQKEIETVESLIKEADINKWFNKWEEQIK